MGDPKRFDLFAKKIKEIFPHAGKIADIAGGKGYLNLSLRELGYSNVITFDTRFISRRVNRISYEMRLFDANIKEDFDLLVGMHPDEATDHIIVEAGKRHIPFIIVPCCVKPSAVNFWGSFGRIEWLTHLCKLAWNYHFDIEMSRLKMQGRNEVMIGFPK